MSDQTPVDRDEERFSFGLAELRRAGQAGPAIGPTAAARVMPTRLRIEKGPPGGFDPYNSTGGFDRNKAWGQIRKR